VGALKCIEWKESDQQINQLSKIYLF